MTGLGDALTVGILLTLVFGAVCFYLYSRLTQNEKRVGLLENLLLSLKLNTEAELEGPSSVQPVSGPAPLEADDVDGVEENQYSELLRHLPTNTPPGTPTRTVTPPAQAEEEAAAALLASVEVTPAQQQPQAQGEASVSVEVNYEAMTLKELQGLAKERGLQVTGKRKPEVIDLLKRQGGAVSAAPIPLDMDSNEEGPAGANEGFQLKLDS
jgi:hypothetical protein